MGLDIRYEKPRLLTPCAHMHKLNKTCFERWRAITTYREGDQKALYSATPWPYRLRLGERARERDLFLHSTASTMLKAVRGVL